MDDILTIAWLAGLLEGEGFFANGTGQSRPFQAGVSVEMTDEDIIAKIASLWNVAYCKPKVRDAKWSQTYKVHVRGKKALAIMREVYPFMGIRRKKRINEIIERCDKTR